MSDMTATVDARTEFTVGRVLRDTFSIYGRNFVNFTILGILLYIPSVAASAALFGFTAPFTRGRVLAASQMFAAGTIMLSLGLSLLSLVLGAFVNAGIAYGAIETLNDRRFTFAALVGRAFSAIIPVILATILFSIALGIGALFLLVPAIIVALMFAVFVPVIVAERRGPIEALGRSRELTRGHRWGILGGYLACIVLLVVVVYGMQFLFLLISPILVIIATLVSSAISASITGCFTAAAYVSLRQEKEGTGVAELASVFD